MRLLQIPRTAVAPAAQARHDVQQVAERIAGALRKRGSGEIDAGEMIVMLLPVKVFQRNALGIELHLRLCVVDFKQLQLDVAGGQAAVQFRQNQRQRRVQILHAQIGGREGRRALIAREAVLQRPRAGCIRLRHARKHAKRHAAPHKLRDGLIAGRVGHGVNAVGGRLCKAQHGVRGGLR